MTDEHDTLPLWHAADVRERRAGIKPVESPPIQEAPAKPTRGKKTAVGVQPSVANVVIPFPYSARRNLAWSIARRAAEFRPRKGEEHIQRQIRLQAETMERRGISTERIAAEAKALEANVRAYQDWIAHHAEDNAG